MGNVINLPTQKTNEEKTLQAMSNGDLPRALLEREVHPGRVVLKVAGAFELHFTIEEFEDLLGDLREDLADAQGISGRAHG